MMGSLVTNRASHEAYVTRDQARPGLLRRFLRALFGRR